MKNILICSMMVFGLLSATAAKFVVDNGDDDNVSTKPVVSKSVKSDSRIAYVEPIAQVAMGAEAIQVAHVASLESPNVLISRLNGWRGLHGMPVSNNLDTDPTAWEPLSENYAAGCGLRWPQLVSTYPMKSWNGGVPTHAATLNEYGGRVVIHQTGNGPASAYELEVLSSLTNLPTMRFNIATNTSNGQELTFSQFYVGINPGANGVIDSSFDDITGRVVARGDDTVLQNGERPSTSTYTHFRRFGATIRIMADSQVELDAIRDQFARGEQTITLNVYKSGTKVLTRVIRSAKPAMLLAYGNTPNTAVLYVQGGQPKTVYRIQSCTNIVSPVWTPFAVDQALVKDGVMAIPVNRSEQMRFFRIHSEY